MLWSGITWDINCYTATDSKKGRNKVQQGLHQQNARTKTANQKSRSSLAQNTLRNYIWRLSNLHIAQQPTHWEVQPHCKTSNDHLNDRLRPAFTAPTKQSRWNECTINSTVHNSLLWAQMLVYPLYILHLQARDYNQKGKVSYHMTNMKFICYVKIFFVHGNTHGFYEFPCTLFIEHAKCGNLAALFFLIGLNFS